MLDRPWGWLTIRLLFRGDQSVSRLEGWTLFGLGLWVWLQLVATGYARGAGGPAPASRYLDNLVFGCVANLLALGWLLAQSDPRRWHRYILSAATVAWLAVFGFGAVSVAHQAFAAELPSAAFRKRTIVSTRAYLATGDVSHLDSPDIPYPGATAFIDRIGHPELARLMPMSVRPAISLQPDSGPIGFAPRWLESVEPTAGQRSSSNSFATSFASPEFRRIWSSSNLPTAVNNTADWTSLPVEPPGQRGQLVFAISGDPGSTSASLQLRAVRGQRLLSEIRPGASTEGWTYAVVPAPNEPFTVHAHDASPNRGFAFSEPVLMPTLSYVAWRLTERSPGVAAIGFLTMLAAAAGILTIQRSQRPPLPAKIRSERPATSQSAGLL